jgi:hypothetical protein
MAKFADYLKTNFSESSKSHLDELRKRLLENGHIKTFEQKTIRGETAIRFALSWYEQELNRQTEKGSTGSYGKFFELSSRCLWAIYHNRPMNINDIKCRPSKYKDMTIKVHGVNYHVELKTETGNLTYADEPLEALQELEKKYRENPIFVWDYRKDGVPLAMKFRDLVDALDNFNEKGFSTWVTMNRDTNGVYSVKFQSLKKSNVKLEYLDSLAQKGYDWQTVLQTGELDLGDAEE